MILSSPDGTARSRAVLSLFFFHLTCLTQPVAAYIEQVCVHAQETQERLVGSETQACDNTN